MICVSRGIRCKSLLSQQSQRMGDAADEINSPNNREILMPLMSATTSIMEVVVTLKEDSR